MEMFKSNYVFLDVEGFLVNPGHVKHASSSPLISYNSGNLNTAHWGFQGFEYPDRSFWLTELCILRGNNEYTQHYIPGAYIKVHKNTPSYNTYKHAWLIVNNQYTFRRDEIESQWVVRDYLKNIIDSDTVVFYKGGEFEKIIAKLCHAKEYVNIETLGCKFKAQLKSPIVESTCKVHDITFHYCPLQEVCYFMNKVSEWLPVYESNKAKEIEEDNM